MCVHVRLPNCTGALSLPAGIPGTIFGTPRGPQGNFFNPGGPWAKFIEGPRIPRVILFYPAGAPAPLVFLVPRGPLGH